jgi:hypothetical protein
VRSHHDLVALLALLVLGCSGREPRAGDSCFSADDCVGERPLSCLQQECVRLSCSRSPECPAGAACVDGICQVPECSDDDDCRPHELCFEGDCRGDVCRVKAECDRNEVCIGVPGICQPPPSRCTVDAECPVDTFCKLPEGACEPRCTSDRSCPDGSYCDGEFCRLRCTSSADCAAADVCVDGRCVADACGEVSCPPATPFVEPASCECVGCLTDSDCRADDQRRCSDAGECLYCLIRAESSSACAEQGLRLVDGCCAECGADRDCPDGTHCEVGRCIIDDPRECVVDADCPEPGRCDLGWCVLPGTMTPCELQRDCPDGEACYSDGRCRAESTVCEGCADPGRCVAEPGDDVGTCTGCTELCAPDGCPSTQVCFVPEQAGEGFCVAPETVQCGD